MKVVCEKYEVCTANQKCPHHVPHLPYPMYMENNNTCAAPVKCHEFGSICRCVEVKK